MLTLLYGKYTYWLKYSAVCIHRNLFIDMKNIKYVIYTFILFLNSEPRNEFVATYTRGYLDYRICSWKQMRSALFSPRFNDTPTLLRKVIKTFNCVGNIVRRNQTEASCKEDGEAWKERKPCREQRSFFSSRGWVCNFKQLWAFDLDLQNLIYCQRLANNFTGILICTWF